MRKARVIDLKRGQVELDDGSVKVIDNYVFELEDRLIKLLDILKDYADVNPDSEYLVSGETLFKAMDILEEK